MKRLSISWIFAVLAALALLLKGCTSPSADQSSPLVLATLKGPSSMGMIRLIDSLENGKDLNTEVIIFNEPLQVRKMMIEKSADFVILPTTMAALLYNKGLEYHCTAIPVWGTLYLVGKDSVVADWEDLRGKRVNVMARGMTPDVLFRYLLRENGITPEKDITLDYSFPTHIDLANAVAAGQCDLAVISEPLVSMVLKKNNSLYRVFNLDDEWTRFEGIPVAETSFMVSKSALMTHPEEVERLMAGYELSTRWVNQYPDSAASLIVKYGILPDVEVARSSIQRSNLKFVAAKDIRPVITAYLDVFYQMNPDIIGGRIPDEDFIY